MYHIIAQNYEGRADLELQGIFGALSRTVRRPPPCVWVVNEHSEEITVVISQYRPSRLWSGTDLNASASGAGLGFSTTVSGNSGGLRWRY